MKRFLPYILIFSVILQFFAPFSLQTNKGFDYKINAAEAADTTDFKLTITPTTTSSTISLKILLNEGSDITSIAEKRGLSGNIEFELTAYVFDSGGPGDGKKIAESKPVILNASHTSSPIIIDFTGLKPSTLYVSNVLISEFEVAEVTHIDYENTTHRISRGVVFKQVFSTPTVEEGKTQIFTDIEGGASGSGLYVDPLPKCGITNISGCIARVIYYLVFKPTSFLFALAGKVMDFTIMYSLSDSSYRSPFVSEGWQVVRDLCNMFFIFILLYIAFTTILDTGGSKNKNAVINVIIVGLLINFSLFATHLIIDASNIMARVFYNPKVMVIGPKVDGKVVGEVGKDFNEIKLSEAIVSKVDPQELLAESSTIGEVNSKSNVIKNEEEGGLTAGNFILVTLLASAVNIVGMIAFLSISLAFVGRVLGLWLAMVLSPLAFLTLTIPQLKDKKYIGWTKWWPETINIAFMAPIFVFFMYIIVMFLEKKLGLASLQNTSLTGINKVLSIIVPFILIIFLINQAKKIAIEMSGEIGQQFSKVGSSVGGFALGAMTGGAAMAMRGTVGRLGARIMSSETLKETEAKGGVRGFGAKQLRNIGGFAGKSSFDVRNTSAGASIDKGLGVKSGKGQAGGFIKKQEEQIKRKEGLAKNLEVGKFSKEKQEIQSNNLIIQRIQNAGNVNIDDKEKSVEDKKNSYLDAKENYDGNPSTEAKLEMEEKRKEWQREKKELSDIKKGGIRVGDKYLTDNGVITKKGEEELMKKVEEEEEKLLELAQLKEKEKVAIENNIKEAENLVTQLEKKSTEILQNNGGVMDETYNKIAEQKNQAKNNLGDLKSKKDTLVATIESNYKDKIASVEKSVKDSKDVLEQAVKEVKMAGGYGKSIGDYREENKNLNKEVDTKNRNRKMDFIKNQNKTSSIIFNVIASGGQYSQKAADLASDNIIKSIKKGKGDNKKDKEDKGDKKDKKDG